MASSCQTLSRIASARRAVYSQSAVWDRWDCVGLLAPNAMYYYSPLPFFSLRLLWRSYLHGKRDVPMCMRALSSLARVGVRRAQSSIVITSPDAQR